ncbi:uncharacterized protein LOC126266943 [Schistocerca gregaria]|uniref:uncharacterized protein LOC126266943 n=1 Tax=Schistocerca gregaria TaxID=7010 RepID=UPI00211F39DB|nr:uncharacterized protein LOC126266943 [Schistocerca gregaria]XP_049827600.1 uncharacterized protein LOC126266943 [Schistocerca gregaria]XP_049827602.1 uncharacterized protein LOC126266943 [Schistocerca gregaria]
MSADVCAVLGPEVSECLTAVVEKHGSDGSGCTVLDCLAARDLLSGDRAVCLVCLMHTPVHHRNVLARLGVPKPETHAALYFVDALSQLGCISGCSPDDLFSQIIKVISAAQVSGISHLSLILDDVSVLLDIGWDLKQVISFLSRLRSLKLASMAVLTHTAGADTLTSLLAAALIHSSDTAVSVLPLSTGVSADVSGTLIIRHLQRPNNTPQTFHFRLTDRQVKVFAPGSIR